MEFEKLVSTAAEYGFPMLVSWYLLVRMEEKLDKLSSNIEALTHTITLQTSR